MQRIQTGTAFFNQIAQQKQRILPWHIVNLAQQFLQQLALAMDIGYKERAVLTQILITNAGMIQHQPCTPLCFSQLPRL